MNSKPFLFYCMKLLYPPNHSRRQRVRLLCVPQMGSRWKRENWRRQITRDVQVRCNPRIQTFISWEDWKYMGGMGRKENFSEATRQILSLGHRMADSFSYSFEISPMWNWRCLICYPPKTPPFFSSSWCWNFGFCRTMGWIKYVRRRLMMRAANLLPH